MLVVNGWGNQKTAGKSQVNLKSSATISLALSRLGTGREVGYRGYSMASPETTQPSRQAPETVYALVALEQDTQITEIHFELSFDIQSNCNNIPSGVRNFQ